MTLTPSFQAGHARHGLLSRILCFEWNLTGRTACLASASQPIRFHLEAQGLQWKVLHEAESLNKTSGFQLEALRKHCKSTAKALYP